MKIICSNGKQEKVIDVEDNLFHGVNKENSYPLIIDDGNTKGVLGSVAFSSTGTGIIRIAPYFTSTYETIENKSIISVKCTAEDDYLFQIV